MSAGRGPIAFAPGIEEYLVRLGTREGALQRRLRAVRCGLFARAVKQVDVEQ